MMTGDPKFEPPHFVFVVALTGGVRKTWARCQRRGRTWKAHTVTEGRVLLETPRRYAGILLGSTLGDESPLALLELARRRNPLAPIAVVLRKGERCPPGLLRKHRAMRLAWEAGVTVLDRFLLDAALVGATDERDLHAAKRALVIEYGLDVRETEVLTLALDRVPRAQWPELLSRADSTVKHTITTLLRKMGADSLQELMVRVRAPRAANDDRTRCPMPMADRVAES